MVEWIHLERLGEPGRKIVLCTDCHILGTEPH